MQDELQHKVSRLVFLLTETFTEIPINRSVKFLYKHKISINTSFDCLSINTSSYSVSVNDTVYRSNINVYTRAKCIDIKLNTAMDIYQLKLCHNSIHDIQLISELELLISQIINLLKESYHAAKN